MTFCCFDSLLSRKQSSLCLNTKYHVTCYWSIVDSFSAPWKWSSNYRLVILHQKYLHYRKSSSELYHQKTWWRMIEETSFTHTKLIAQMARAFCKIDLQNPSKIALELPYLRSWHQVQSVRFSFVNTGQFWNSTLENWIWKNDVVQSVCWDVQSGVCTTMKTFLYRMVIAKHKCFRKIVVTTDGLPQNTVIKDRKLPVFKGHMFIISALDSQLQTVSRKLLGTSQQEGCKVD